MLADRGPTRAQDVLAANLRRMRIARHLSLSQLARATGTSKATLSSIERADGNPTVDTLASLAGALRVALGELLEAPPLDEVRVVRATQRRPVSGEPVCWHELASLAPSAAGNLTELALQANQLCELEPRASGSRVHVYMLAGKLIAGPLERITELSAGDYASFPVDRPHLYESRRHPARAVVLTQEPP